MLVYSLVSDTRQNSSQVIGQQAFIQIVVSGRIQHRGEPFTLYVLAEGRYRREDSGYAELFSVGCAVYLAGDGASHKGFNEAGTLVVRGILVRTPDIVVSLRQHGCQLRGFDLSATYRNFSVGTRQEDEASGVEFLDQLRNEPDRIPPCDDRPAPRVCGGWEGDSCSIICFSR